MSKKPKPRSLSAEPLEERLPVSSSAAGVLFGYGLTPNEPGVERSATPGYEVSQTTPASVAQQPSPIDLTLDVQLDALAVDLFHAEESLLDTISSASPDPFVLTPLTPSVAISDTETDALRELGDELLLYQISTLDFTQVSFDPVTPEREPVSHDFGDALTPPEDLTAYGYSPIANELQEKDDEGGTRCGCGCGCSGGSGCGCSLDPHIGCISISGCGATATYGISNNPQFNFSDKTFYTMENQITVTWSYANADKSAAIIVTDSWGTVIDVENPSSLIVKSPGSPPYINYFWNIPPGTSKSQVQNKFTFTFIVENNAGVQDSKVLYVHFGYAEVQVAFAGRGDFHESSATGPKTLQNTLIVGQQLHAKLFYDATKFGLTSNSWTAPWGGMIVKGYKTEYDEGAIIHFGASDWTSSEFKCYYSYSSASGAIGGITNTMKFTDPHGYVHTVNGGASYYLEAAVCNTAQSNSGTFASWSNGAGSVGIRPFEENGPLWLMLGGTETCLVNGVMKPVPCSGIEWSASVTAPKYGDGVIAFAQLVNDETEIMVTGDPKPWYYWTHGEYMLDSTHPYDKDEDEDGETPIDPEQTITISSEDSPGIQLQHFGSLDVYTKVDVQKSDFTVYCIYKPSGDSIWVTLAMMKWKYTATAVRTGPSQWVKTAGTPSIVSPWQTSSVLPVWDDNADNHQGRERK